MITDKNALKIGQLFSRCCVLDLYPIESQDDINDIIESWEDDDMPAMVFENKNEAEEYFKKRD